MGSIEKQVKPSEDEACLQAMLFSSTHILPLVLHAAIELDLFRIIAGAGPAAASMSPSEIASRLPTQDHEAPARLDRMLRLLASHSLLTSSVRTLEDGRVERLYGPTPACHFFLRKEDGGSLASVSAFHRATLDGRLQLKDAVLQGEDPFQKAHGMPAYQYMDMDPSLNEIFNKAMADLSTVIMKKILEVYQGFEGLTSLVDVGGGTGKCLNMIISNNPSIKGINFDMPRVVQTAPSYPGIEHVGGDMFLSVPTGDAIMLKNTLHNWSDENCLKLLRNCYEALPNNGKVIVIEALMPEAPESSMASQYVSRLDNIMFMAPGGRERTEKEFETLCMGSGFSNFKRGELHLHIIQSSKILDSLHEEIKSLLFEGIGLAMRMLL